MTQKEKDDILKKIDSISNKVVNGGGDYMDGRDDALKKLRTFVNKMKVTEKDMAQEEKDAMLKKIDRIYDDLANDNQDYMEGKDDALSQLRAFIKKMNVTE